MITNQTEVRELQPKEWAIATAKLCWEKWQEKKPPEKRVKFEDQLMEYLCNGFVVSRPTCFWMGKIIDLTPDAKEGDEWKEGELGWFVRMAVGDMRELLETLPAVLPRIAFTRREDPRVRSYPLERFVELVYNETFNKGMRAKGE